MTDRTDREKAEIQRAIEQSQLSDEMVEKIRDIINDPEMPTVNPERREE